MAFPPQLRETGPALPSMIDPNSDRFSRSRHDLFSRSPAMSIPSTHDSRVVAPPPLPPPPMPFGEHHDAMPRASGDHPHFPPSFSSGYGSIADERSRYARRNPGSPHEKDEGYSSLSSTERSNNGSFPPRAVFGLHHNKFQFQSPADGDSMKNKLSNPLARSEKPTSVLCPTASDLLSRRPPMSIQMPMHTRVLEGPHRIVEAPLPSIASPRPSPFQHGLPGQRSPLELSEMDRSPPRRVKRNNSDDASMASTYEFSGADDMELDESSPKRSYADDTYMGAGIKRRAASPLRNHDSPNAIAYRESGPRGSPTPRLITTASSSTMPMVSRTNSYMSTTSAAPSTAPTANSFGRRSPGGYSNGGLSPTSATSPYITPISLNPSPRTSMSIKVPPSHSRAVSSTSTRKLSEVQKPLGSKVQGFYMCDCCPKKPRKFETEGELQAHEAEKQYECSYCGNRFKNKNEMERHQNSLHLRRHSWSCSALSGYGRAFHESAVRPGEADVCGYCGEEFPRSGQAAPNAPKHATEEDWVVRARHLQDNHKFRECNSTKKFFRADHFRQHLKHSHAGTSGKWTNMLENACMIEEEPPTPR